jgi:pyrimidine-nucleoside phosphorylase
MRIQDIIAVKKEANPLTADQIRTFIHGYASGEIPDYQAAALVMAIAIHGMNPAELEVWTDAMLHSGKVVDLSAVAGTKVDKHSTGGVGDKISICLAPAVAACGVPVPMISGRGLGHTGGTLDKLEAIPGFDVNLSTERFVRQVGQIGVCLIGQTADLAPADRKLYALRDVTATVESIPLIASSIMSKKLAEGIDGLVLDVKVGDGAFMKTMPQARKLAETLVEIGSRAGKRVTAFLTRMDQVLGRQVGNANETAEAIEILHGRGPHDVYELTVTLGAEMLRIGNVCTTEEQAKKRIEHALSSGEALQKMVQIIEAQNGDPKVCENTTALATADHVKEIPAPQKGYVLRMRSRSIGQGAMLLGAGRQTAEDDIDPAVGVTINKKVGDSVEAGESLATVHYNNAQNLQDACARIAKAFDIGPSAVEKQPLILDVIRGS